MYLTYPEANMLARAGEDIRMNSWPADWFVRLTPPGYVAPPGWFVQTFNPKPTELASTQWRKA